MSIPTRGYVDQPVVVTQGYTSSGSALPPPPPPITGDSHFPLIMWIDKFGSAGSDLQRIEFSPIFRWDDIGVTAVKFHLIGECVLLNPGKTVEVRMITGSVFADPAIATFTITGSGMFHLTQDIVLPNGAQRYFLAHHTDNPGTPFLQSFSWIVEVS